MFHASERVGKIEEGVGQKIFCAVFFLRGSVEVQI